MRQRSLSQPVEQDDHLIVAEYNNAHYISVFDCTNGRRCVALVYIALMRFRTRPIKKFGGRGLVMPSGRRKGAGHARDYGGRGWCTRCRWCSTMI